MSLTPKNLDGGRVKIRTIAQWTAVGSRENLKTDFFSFLLDKSPQKQKKLYIKTEFLPT